MAIISKLKAVLSLDNKQFEKGLKNSEKQTKGFGTSLVKLGGVITAAFSVVQIARFGKELVELNETAVGVRKAFSGLNQPDLLDDLRKATGGMVSDLQLMQKTVQASNLGLDVNNLATYFEFATIRAAETGVAVDQLVNNIVDGIGRKSTMILDNLGIGLVDIQNEMAKVGDFTTAATNLIQRGLDNSTLTVEDAAKATAQLGTAWENLKLAMSDFVNSPQVQAAIKLVTEALKAITPDTVTTADYVSELKNVQSAYDGIAATLERINKGEENAGQDKINFLNLELDRIQVLIDGLKTEIELRNRLNSIPPPQEQGKTVASPISPMKSKTPGIFGAGIDDLPGFTVAFDKYRESLENVNIEVTALAEHELDMPAPSEADIQAWKDLNEVMREQIQVGQFVAAGIASIADAAGSMIGGMSSEDAISGFIANIGGLMKQFGALLISFGTAELALQSGNPYVMIAAGAALVAIGAAITASRNKISSNAGSGYSVGGSYGGGTFGTGGYTNQREIVLVARGKDLVGVLNKQTYQDYNNG